MCWLFCLQGKKTDSLGSLIYASCISKRAFLQTDRIFCLARKTIVWLSSCFVTRDMLNFRIRRFPRSNVGVLMMLSTVVFCLFLVYLVVTFFVSWWDAFFTLFFVFFAFLHFLHFWSGDLIAARTSSSAPGHNGHWGCQQGLDTNIIFMISWYHDIIISWYHMKIVNFIHLHWWDFIEMYFQKALLHRHCWLTVLTDKKIKFHISAEMRYNQDTKNEMCSPQSIKSKLFLVRVGFELVFWFKKSSCVLSRRLACVLYTVTYLRGGYQRSNQT